MKIVNIHTWAKNSFSTQGQRYEHSFLKEPSQNFIREKHPAQRSLYEYKINQWIIVSRHTFSGQCLNLVEYSHVADVETSLRGYCKGKKNIIPLHSLYD